MQVRESDRCSFRSGGELFDRLVDEGTFDEALAARIMQQIVQAVAYCHSRGVAHRDLKVNVI